MWDYGDLNMKYWNVKKILVLICFVFVVSFSIFFLFRTKFATQDHSAMETCLDGWDIYVNGRLLNYDSLSKASVEVIDKDETVELVTTLPSTHYDNAAINFYSIQALVEVYIDHSLVYTFGQEYYDTGRIVPKRVNFVPLGENYENKLIRIKYLL